MKKLALIILDGWGLGNKSISDAIHHAKTPFTDALFNDYPNSKLKACGASVGLPEGQMGNSEVGHLNIGSGRIVYQELSRINNAISEGSFYENPVLLEAMRLAKENNVKLHMMGLVSKGGVHSSLDHLIALIAMCKHEGLQNVYLHAFTDGRDCDPKCAQNDIAELMMLTDDNVQLATLIGRYYSMDRDHRWERIEKAYSLMVKGKGEYFENPVTALTHHYKTGITDEFMPPILLDKKGLIENGDVVINFNFRTDRPREITEALTQKEFPEFDMHPLSLHYFTMTNYDDSFKNLHVIFNKDALKNTLGEILSAHKVTQVRISETEKYPHVTYFFNGGREVPFPNETRLLIHSPKVATYDLKPEMSAFEVRDTLLSYAEENNPGFICLNFANPDMVGHTGVYEAIVKAVETVDTCLESLVKGLQPYGYEFLIIADHGNADHALNADGSPNTAHSLNEVPCIYVGTDKTISLRDGILADVAPTILGLMEISLPIEMTGTSLIQKRAEAL